MNFIENPAFTSAVISEDIILQKIGDPIHISCPVESEGKKKSRYIFGQTGSSSSVDKCKGLTSLACTEGR